MNDIHSDSTSCALVRDYLDSYLNNELLVETNHLVLGHLRRCTACGSVLRGRRRIKAILKNAVAGQPVPDQLEERVRSALRGRRVEPGKWLMLAAATVILVMMYMTIPTPSWRASAPGQPPKPVHVPGAETASILQIGLDEHVKCAIDDGFSNQQFDDATIRQKLGPEYEGLLAVVREAVPQGFVVRAGHRCDHNGRPFVHLMLSGPGGTVSLLLTRKQDQSFGANVPAAAVYSSAIYYETVGEMSVAAFETNAYFAFVVSPVPQETNRLIATTVEPGIRRFFS